MTEQEREILEAFVGATLVSFHQDEEPQLSEGDWRDDPPLLLAFSNGRTLELSAYGFHASGGLGIEFGVMPSAPPARIRPGAPA